MVDLDNLDLDIQLLTSDEFDQYDDLAEIFEDNNTDTTCFDDIGCEEVVNDVSKVKFPVSLLVGGKVIPCLKSIVIESEYLSNMAEVFENSEALPVPEIVRKEDIKEITEFYQILNLSDSCDFYMEIKLRNLDLEFKIDLLIVSDLLGFNKLKPFILKSVRTALNSANWKLIYSRCHTIMGLSSILDHLLDFLLHHTATQHQDGSMKDWTEMVSFQFMERILNQTVFEISEEVKFELVMDWASCRSISEEEIFSLLSMIHFKCFKEVKLIHQAESDLSQLGFLSSENLSEIVRKLKEAKDFKENTWSLGSTSTGDYVRLLTETKNETNWPKLLGCASSDPGIYESDELLLLNDQFRNYPTFDYGTMELLIRSLSYCPNICYRSSIFYIFYPNPYHYPKLQPQLCQFNLDFKKCFHVLDLPLALRSINDQHRQRKNLVMICNVKNHLYLFSKDAFSKQHFDSVEKLKVYRIDLDLAIESCNDVLALENALVLKWDYFSDIPESYLEDCDINFAYDVKAVDVGEDIFILSNDLCITLNISTKVWTEKELAPPARNNPVVFGSDSELFVIGGTCMGQALLSGQKYKTETWKMELLPSIPDKILPIQDLKDYKGIHFNNFIYLYRSIQDSSTGVKMQIASEEKLIFDLFHNQWTSKQYPVSNLYCLDKPIWL